MLGNVLRHLILWCLVPWLIGLAFATAIAGIRFLLHVPAHSGKLDVLLFKHYIVVTPSVIMGMTIAAAAMAIVISLSIARRIVS
ncbi:MAG: hypothetical protein WA734_04560 [Candidatus Acidiferrales bacterium]